MIEKDEEMERRVTELFEYALGDEILGYLRKPGVTDIMLNENGSLWVDDVENGRHFSGHRISRERGEAIIRVVASRHRTPVTKSAPVLDNSSLPTGERISGTIAPVTDGPTFAIRVPYSATVDPSKFGGSAADIVTTGDRTAELFSGEHVAQLMHAVDAGKNILLAGATGSGKTTLANCLLQRMKERRLCVIEDTRELVIPAADHVRFVAVKSVVEMGDLLHLALRYRPDSIIVGELRKPMATKVYLLSSNTGHGGNLATIHANDCISALHRIEDLSSGGDDPLPARAIRSAIDIVAFVKKMPDNSRRITEIMDVGATPVQVAA